MAKGKKAAALFEVIHLAKKGPEKTPSGALSTPKWWFKGRSPSTPAAEHTQTPIEESRAPEAPTLTPSVKDESTGSAETVASQAPEHDEEREHVRYEPPAPIHAPREEIGSPPRRSLGARIGLDRPQQLLNFKLTYTTAGIAAFALVVVVLVSFVVGRQLSGGPQRAGASASIDQLRAGPSFPDVLKVSGSGGTSQEIDEPASSDSTAARQAVPTQDKPVTPAPGERVQRIVGMQYVVVQSYPDEEDAKQAADILTKSGVRCTVERGLPGWGSSWYSVVGATGFARTRNAPEYDSYIKAILDVNKQFAGSSKFKKFNPMPIGWKDPKAQG